MRRLICLTCAALIMTGCSAAGHGGAAGPMARPQPAPSALPAGSNAVFVIKIPKAKKVKDAKTFGVHPHYVSPSTQSIGIAANGGSPLIAGLTPTSPGCVPPTHNTPLTCTISAAEPVGNDTFQFTTYDQVGGTGNALSTATVQTTIVAGQANNVSVTLNGIVVSLALLLSQPNPPQGSPAVIGLAVDALDADGNVIGSPGSFVDANGQPVTITLTDSDSTFTVLSQTTVTSPSDNVTVNYDGGALTSALFSATTGSISTTGNQDAVLTPSPSGTTVPMPAPATLSDNGAGDVQMFSVTEPDYSGTFTATSSDETIGSVSTLDGINFTVTGGSNAGTCTLTVSDSNGNLASVYVTNTITNVIVN